MAEAFGLAAGILQVVDFGTRFAFTARQFYQSATEGVDGLLALQAIAVNLKAVLETLLANAQDNIETLGDVDDISLTKECAETLSEMLNTLEKIHVSGKGRKRDTTVAAFKFLWNKGKIDALQDRLDQYSKQLILNLAFSLKMHAITSLKNQEEILAKLNTLTSIGDSITDGSASISTTGFGSMVVEYLTRALKESSRDARKASLRQALIDAVYKGQDGNEASSKIHTSPAHRDRLYNAFIVRLHYPGIQDRELRIIEAHENTFRWIFEGPKHDTAHWSNFKSWLGSNEQVFWITGKAGAGKSTLMKFITQPEKPNATKDDQQPSTAPQARCAKYWPKRADGKPFTMASFYFWAAGSTSQKSKMGLFFTLLAQLLRAYPEAIPFASPSRWEALSLFNEDPRDFTEDELCDMFHRAVVHIDSMATPVLFIDGLDEFDGDHQMLISLLHDIISKSSAKLCAASRPWVEFEKAFESKPSLRLEDLTYSDMTDYVTAKFNSDTSFRDLQQRETHFANTLIETIVMKASGVFLWVHLVVHSLLAGISYGDRISDLKRRLDLLPPDLEMLYERITDSIDPFYRKHAAGYFLLMQSCPEPPSALLLSFADEDEPTKFAMTLTTGSTTTEQMASRLNVMRRRVNSRCKGLLEVDRSTQSTSEPDTTFSLCEIKVHYLHKTVKDYVENPEAQKKLTEISDDAHIKLLAARLALFKVLGGKDGPVIKECMYHAARATPRYRLDVIRLLDSLCEAAIGSSISIPVHSPMAMSTESRFLCLAVNFGVFQYVGAKVNRSCLVPVDRTLPARAKSWDQERVKGYGRILEASKTWIRGLHRSIDASYPLLQLPFSGTTVLDGLTVTMVATLLQKGGYPNYSFKVRYLHHEQDSSPWESVIVRIARAFSRAFYYESNFEGEREALGKIARLMIDHGAVVNQLTIASALGRLYGDFSILNEADQILMSSHSSLSRYSYYFDNKDEIKRILYRALKHMKEDKNTSTFEFEQEFYLRIRYVCIG